MSESACRTVKCECVSQTRWVSQLSSWRELGVSIARWHLLHESGVALRPDVNIYGLRRRLAALALWVEIYANIVQASAKPARGALVQHVGRETRMQQDSDHAHECDDRDEAYGTHGYHCFHTRVDPPDWTPISSIRSVVPSSGGAGKCV